MSKFKDYPNGGHYKEDYEKCLKDTNGKHNFGEVSEVGYTSYPCKNCGFLLVTYSHNSKDSTQN